MLFDFSQFEKDLNKALSLFDSATAIKLCDELQEFLNSSTEEVPAKKLENVLQALRNKRMFAQMQKMGDWFLQTGRTTYKIRRQYAQSLIDQGIYSAAICILTELKRSTENDKTPQAENENREALGLLGRVYKQLYVNASQPENPRFVDLLKLAIQYYQQVYTMNPKENLWHGINMVALIKRAQADKIVLTGFPDPDQIAKEIIGVIEEKDAEKKADVWDFATAMEACIALDKANDALEWANKYINSQNRDEFEISSTLRQLQELWRLDPGKEIGKELLPVLQSALLKREGGNVVLNTSDLQKQKEPDAASVEKLERVFGITSYQAFEWYRKGLGRCYPVARIGKNSTKGAGTGFLLKGKQLHPDLKDQIVLLTNAHVISDVPLFQKNSLKPNEVVVILETVNKETELRLEKLFLTSPSNELDFSILIFDEESRKQLIQLTANIDLYNISEALPSAEDKDRIYIIGHPWGGSLQISLQDNVFLAQKEQYLHYRTPTDPGSSGSPIFNDNWDLIGIHHSGKQSIKESDSEEANEGIWMQSIIKFIAEKINKN